MRVSNIKKHSAFTMLELIFVIVILGIVASIGSQIIVDVYESYITQRAVHRSSIKTELAATQLVNRLAYSIPGTVIGRFDNNNFVSIENMPLAAPLPTILEWIGYDNDGFGAIDGTTNQGRRPRWSGYCDVTASTINQLSTPGSRLTQLNAIIQNLSAVTGVAQTSLGNAAVIFPHDNPDTLAHSVGFAEAVRSFTNVHPIARNAVNNTHLDLAPHVNRTIHEHYKLAWTAYAVVPGTALTAAQKTARGFPAADNTNVFDLQLCYDYQPWAGERHNNGATCQTLLRNVSVFRFTGTGSTLRFKICQREIIGENFTINTCKEKAVIR